MDQLDQAIKEALNLLQNEMKLPDSWDNQIPNMTPGASGCKEPAKNKGRGAQLTTALNLNSKVKPWYLENYPNEHYGAKLNDSVTFNDVLAALNQGTHLLSVLGAYDSTVNQRVFEALSKMMHVPFETVFSKWHAGRAVPDIAPDDLVREISQNEGAAQGYYIISVEEPLDTSYGPSVVQYGREDGFVSFAFSKVPPNEALCRPELVLAELVREQETQEAPLWSDLSKVMLGLVIDSSFDMLFVEHDDEGWTEEAADAIWSESCDKCLNSVVTAGEDGCLITVYAGAMGSVNWSHHPVYGKPCLEHKLEVKKVPLNQQIQSAASRSNKFLAPSFTQHRDAEPSL